MANITIEAACKSDLYDILTLQKAAYRSEAEIYNDFTIAPLRQTLAELKEEYKTHLLLKAEIDGEIVGSVRAYEKGDVCYIGRLIVAPLMQNQGIGAKLLHAVESKFQNVKRFELFTGDKSFKNLHIYQRHGYEVFRKEVLSSSLTIIYLKKDEISESKK